MILPDVTVLVFAFRRESPDHELYARWLATVVKGADELALHDASLASFVRISSKPRIFDHPAPTSVTLDFAHRLVSAPRARWPPPSRTTWATFGALVRRDVRIAGNLVPDALLASLAITHGCRLATGDRGFARYPGLHWFDPTGRSRRCRDCLWCEPASRCPVVGRCAAFATVDKGRGFAGRSGCRT